MLPEIGKHFVLIKGSADQEDIIIIKVNTLKSFKIHKAKFDKIKHRNRNTKLQWRSNPLAYKLKDHQDKIIHKLLKIL